MSFFFNHPPPTALYTLSLHDALPISRHVPTSRPARPRVAASSRSTSRRRRSTPTRTTCSASRSEEHTSELQSPDHLVCRLLLEKKKNINRINILHRDT